MEPCFGRRARRAAHISDPRRWKEVNPKGVTAAARRCRASLLTRVRRAAEAALPDARRDRATSWGRTLEARDDWDAWDGRVQIFFFLLQGSQASAGVRYGVKRVARGVERGPGELYD